MTRTPPRAGLNFLPEDDFRVAAMPFFEAGQVEALETDIDARWGATRDASERPYPTWHEPILDQYASEDALYGHGVWMSFLSGRWTPRHERWMEQLAAACRARRYRHVSEHFGWMTSGPFYQGTLLPAPRTAATIALGIDRLRRLADAAGRPVGLENNAATLGPADALEQGAFLAEILDGADGFLLLDVHNVWTQAVNLGLDPIELVRSYPLDRVREVHVSGGDWYECAVPEAAPVRMDSHDGEVPAGVWPLVREVLAHAPALEVVILERRADTLGDERARDAYRADFRRLLAEIDVAFAEAADAEAVA